MFNQNKLKAQMVLKGKSARELCKALDINESTFYRKLNNDGSFTREEISVIAKELEIKDLADIFFS